MTDSCAAGGRRAQVPRPPRGCGRSPAARGARAGTRPRPGPREPARSSSSERLAPSRAAATSGGATPRRGPRGWPAATGGSPRIPPGPAGKRVACPEPLPADARGSLRLRSGVPSGCRPARSPAPCRPPPGSYLRPAAIGRVARSAAAPPRQRRVPPPFFPGKGLGARGRAGSASAPGQAVLGPRDLGASDLTSEDGSGAERVVKEGVA